MLADGQTYGDGARMSRRSGKRAPSRSKLYAKTYTMQAWDWKEDPRRYVRALCRPFGIRPRLTDLDPAYPEKLLKLIARKHQFQLYDAPSLEGRDTYGFILSQEKLTAPEIQQIAADHWSEDFDKVYDSSLVAVMAHYADRIRQSLPLCDPATRHGSPTWYDRHSRFGDRPQAGALAS